MAIDDRKFFPLIQGLRLNYQSEAPGEPMSHSSFEILSVKTMSDRVSVKCRNTWTSDGRSGEGEFYLDRCEDGIYQGKVLIFPLPLEIGFSWPSWNNEEKTVSARDAQTAVPAGEFDHCLQITYMIAGGDAGGGQEFYAPGIGLVRHDHGDEASPWLRELVSHNVVHDAFISHASEDTVTVARPIAEGLKARGLLVWYDDFVLSVGASLKRSIDDGLSRSRYGIVILSPDFLRKDWPRRELENLLAKEDAASRDVILPVLHNIDRADVVQTYPLLGDKKTVSTELGIERVIEDLARAIPDVKLVSLNGNILR